MTTNEKETENATKNETEAEKESETASVNESRKAVGEAPTSVMACVSASKRSETRLKKKRKLRTPVILDGLVAFVGKKAGSWRGLRDTVVARRLNRIRTGERCRECRDLELTEIAMGRGAQLISQLAPIEVQPAKAKRRKRKGKQVASEVNLELASELREEDNCLYLTVVNEEPFSILELRAH